jgi:hypothetical protein
MVGHGLHWQAVVRVGQSCRQGNTVDFATPQPRHRAVRALPPGHTCSAPRRRQAVHSDLVRCSQLRPNSKHQPNAISWMAPQGTAAYPDALSMAHRRGCLRQPLPRLDGCTRKCKPRFAQCPVRVIGGLGTWRSAVPLKNRPDDRDHAGQRLVTWPLGTRAHPPPPTHKCVAGVLSPGFTRAIRSQQAH